PLETIPPLALLEGVHREDRLVSRRRADADLPRRNPELQHRPRRQRLAVHREDRPDRRESPPGAAQEHPRAPRRGPGRALEVSAVLDGLPWIQPAHGRGRKSPRLVGPGDPHEVHLMRYFLIDKVTEIVPGERIRGVKNVTLSDEILHDHFPDFPVMPGALI